LPKLQRGDIEAISPSSIRKRDERFRAAPRTIEKWDWNMATNVTDAEADRIDEYLGDGAYDTWNELDMEADSLVARRRKADELLRSVDIRLLQLSPYGTDWVEKLQKDCASAINLIKQKKYVDQAQFNSLLEMFPAVLDAADLMLKNAEAIPTVWLVAGAAATPAIGFTAAVGRLHSDLMELDELLNEAMDEEIETEIKSALGIVITSVELIVPGLGLVARGGLTAVEVYLADDPTSPAAIHKYGKFGVEALEKKMSHRVEVLERMMGQKNGKYELEALEKMLKKSQTVEHVLGRGGKVLTIAGFYFDIADVLEVKGKVKEIKAAMEKANREFKELQRKLIEVVAGFQRFHHTLLTSEAAARRAIREKSDERDELIERHAYSLVNPVAWKVYDYSKVGLD
jgi:hypothetical protein